jgi:ribosomal protein S18 acetylase RimI-like enzyme
MCIETHMMASLIALSRKAKIKTPELHVLPENPRTLALYKRFGFEHVGVIEKKIRRGRKSTYPIIIMRRVAPAENARPKHGHPTSPSGFEEAVARHNRQ